MLNLFALLTATLAYWTNVLAQGPGWVSFFMAFLWSVNLIFVMEKMSHK